MFVAKWEPGLSPVLPILKTAPVWLDLRGVPPKFFNEEALQYVAGLVGKPICCHPTTVNLSNLEVAKVFTIVDLQKPIPEAVNAMFEGGESTRVRVSCPWLPPTCEFCNEIGHNLKRCPTASILCQDCNSTGHKQENCPRRRKGSQKSTYQKKEKPKEGSEKSRKPEQEQRRAKEPPRAESQPPKKSQASGIVIKEGEVRSNNHDQHNLKPKMRQTSRKGKEKEVSDRDKESSEGSDAENTGKMSESYSSRYVDSSEDSELEKRLAIIEASLRRRAHRKHRRRDGEVPRGRSPKLL